MNVKERKNVLAPAEIQLKQKTATFRMIVTVGDFY